MEHSCNNRLLHAWCTATNELEQAESSEKLGPFKLNLYEGMRDKKLLSEIILEKKLFNDSSLLKWLNTLQLILSLAVAYIPILPRYACGLYPESSIACQTC